MRTASLTCSIVLLSLVSACDHETVNEPLTPGVVSGVVTDAKGSPVEGASVSLVFGVDDVDLVGWNPPPKRPRTNVNFAIAEPSQVKLEVVDHMQRRVKLLIDGVLEAGAHSISWNADDQDGQPVPVGLYHLLLWSLAAEAEEPVTARQPLLLYEHEPEALHIRPHDLTDALGRYQVELGLLPVGEPITITDEGGNPIGENTTISHRVRFVASVEDGGGFRYVSSYVPVSDPDRAFDVDLQIR